MSHTLDFVQGGSTLVSVDDASVPPKFLPATFEPQVEGLGLIDDPLAVNVFGTSADNLNDNLITLERVIELAKDNFDTLAGGYTPIFFQTKQVGASNLVQCEVLGGKIDALRGLIATGNKRILANRVEGVPLVIKRRPYFEETANAAITGSPFTASNNAGVCAIPNTLRGSLAGPLYIQVRTGQASADSLICGLKARGTVANFVAKYEAEDGTLGSGVAQITTADYSPGSGGKTAAQWTPAVTTEQALVGVTITTNLSDKRGKFRVLVAVSDDDASALNTKIRVKVGTYTGAYSLGACQYYGDWGGTGQQKFAPALGHSSNSRPLIDCDIVQIPPLDSANLLGQNFALEVWGQATSTGATHKFTIDTIYLLPCYEGGYESGCFRCTFPTAMGTGAQPDGVIDAQDRVPQGYLVDGTPAFVLAATDKGGLPPYAWFNRSQSLYVLAYQKSNGYHNWNVNNTVTVKHLPRYKLWRGS